MLYDEETKGSCRSLAGEVFCMLEALFLQLMKLVLPLLRKNDHLCKGIMKRGGQGATFGA